MFVSKNTKKKFSICFGTNQRDLFIPSVFNGIFGLSIFLFFKYFFGGDGDAISFSIEPLLCHMLRCCICTKREIKIQKNKKINKKIYKKIQTKLRSVAVTDTRVFLFMSVVCIFFINFFFVLFLGFFFV